MLTAAVCWVYDPDGKDLRNIEEVIVYPKVQLGRDLGVNMYFDLQFKQIHEHTNLEFLKGRLA